MGVCGGGCVCVCGGFVTKSCLTLATPWTAACQVPLSMGYIMCVCVVVVI